MYAIRSYYDFGGKIAFLFLDPFTELEANKLLEFYRRADLFGKSVDNRITSYNVCYTKLLRSWSS